MMCNVEYRFGRLYCQSQGFPEGPVTGGKNIKDALDILEKEQSYCHLITWISDDSHGLVRTERQADELIEYLQTHHGGSVKFAGIKPVDSQHGKLFFSKAVQMEVDLDTTYGEISKALAESLGVDPARIGDITYLL